MCIRDSERPVLSGGVSGGSDVYEKCGSDLHYFSYGTDDFCGDQLFRLSVPVSYTHLDVYKRQAFAICRSSGFLKILRLSKSAA